MQLVSLPIPALLSFAVLCTATPISRRQFGSSANDLENGDCAPVTVIFARGTTEPGNIGTVVGPPLERALQSALGADNVAFQGVDYPANVAGFLQGGDAGGAATMAALARQAVSSCANTQIVMSGYRYVIVLIFCFLGSECMPKSLYSHLRIGVFPVSLYQ
jgi:hypothetical protein